MELLIRGWGRAVVFQERVPSTGEIPLTRCLRAGMIEELNTRRAEWYKMVQVLPGTESWSPAAGARPDGLTDISVCLYDILERYKEHDPHAIVECKRVSEDDAELCRRYVGCGIDRFASGKYGARHTTGFMVGYVISGRACATVSTINRRLSRIKRRAEHLGQSGRTRGAWAWFSRHPRPNPHVPIELHHAFLSF